VRAAYGCNVNLLLDFDPRHPPPAYPPPAITASIASGDLPSRSHRRRRRSRQPWWRSDPEIVLRDRADDHAHMRRVLCGLPEAGPGTGRGGPDGSAAPGARRCVEGGVGASGM